MTIYYCYWIVSGQCNYIGATVDPRKRLRQHCGVISGGARRTRGKLWKFQCVISGFEEWRQALQFEWAAKYYSKGCRGVESRQRALDTLMTMERWTSNSPLACNVDLTVEHCPTQYGLPSNNIPHRPSACKKNVRKKTGYRKTLHGVTY